MGPARGGAARFPRDGGRGRLTLQGRPPHYGIDAPGVRRAMAATGLCGAVLAIALSALSARTGTVLSRAVMATVGASALAGAYGLGMSAHMTWASRIGKLRRRERLLDLAEELSPWTGRERALDIGCGRGLMLVGAARRLASGRAFGIDLWRAEDQSRNGPSGALGNARREGVAGRVDIITGDARALPHPDEAFDIVMSHWVLHNLPTAAGRDVALREMMRVLRPGGTLVLADIAHHGSYACILAAAGWTDLVEDGGVGALAMGLLSGGSFCPRAWVGRKPARDGERRVVPWPPVAA